MNKQTYEGIRFGFAFVIIWLLLLTSYLIYGKMYLDGKENINKVIILPPPIEELQPIGDFGDE